MVEDTYIVEAMALVAKDASDERIEAATGLSLADIIAVRASAAAAPRGNASPGRRRRPTGSGQCRDPGAGDEGAVT